VSEFVEKSAFGKSQALDTIKDMISRGLWPVATLQSGSEFLMLFMPARIVFGNPLPTELHKAPPSVPVEEKPEPPATSPP